MGEVHRDSFQPPTFPSKAPSFKPPPRLKPLPPLPPRPVPQAPPFEPDISMAVKREPELTPTLTKTESIAQTHMGAMDSTVPTPLSTPTRMRSTAKAPLRATRPPIDRSQLAALIDRSLQSKIDFIHLSLQDQDTNDEQDVFEKITYKHELMQSHARMFTEENELFTQDLDTVKSYLEYIKNKFQSNDLDRDTGLFLSTLINEITSIVLYREKGITLPSVQYDEKFTTPYNKDTINAAIDSKIFLIEKHIVMAFDLKKEKADFLIAISSVAKDFIAEELHDLNKLKECLNQVQHLLKVEYLFKPEKEEDTVLIMFLGVLIEELKSTILNNEVSVNYNNLALYNTGNNSITLKDKVWQLHQQGTLKTAIQERYQEIQQKATHFTEVMQKDERHNANMRHQVALMNATGELTPMGEGGGGAYLLKSDAGEPLFVVKPNDEDALCLNNRKGMANPLLDDPKLRLPRDPLRLREDIPLYESAQNEALASDVAILAGLERITPRTIGAVLENDAFYTQDKSHSKKKFCSAQEFIPDSQDFSEYLKDNTKFEIDPTDFEMANLFTWLTGNLDGHLGNYRVFPDAKNSDVIHLRKIDNGLTFGDGTSQSLIENGLKKMLKGKQLSKQGIKIINHLPLKKIVERMRYWGKSENSIIMTLQRMQALQQLAHGPQPVMLEAIEAAMVKLSRLPADHLPTLDEQFWKLL